MIAFSVSLCLPPSSSHQVARPLDRVDGFRPVPPLEALEAGGDSSRRGGGGKHVEDGLERREEFFDEQKECRGSEREPWKMKIQVGSRRGSKRAGQRGTAAALSLSLSLSTWHVLSPTLSFCLSAMRRGSAGQHGAAIGGGFGGYNNNDGIRSQFGRSASALQFSLSRFRHNDRVALALLPALAVVAGSADAIVLWVLLVRRRGGWE